MHKSQAALTALQQKYPNGMPSVHSLNDEQKAWIEMKIQAITEADCFLQMLAELHKIRKRLYSATEDISDKKLQKMISFVFENMEKISKVIQLNEAIHGET